MSRPVETIQKFIVPISLILGIIFSIGLIWLMVSGQHLRPFQDDFYYYAPADQAEAGVLLNERYNWTGRFTTTTIHLVVGWTNSYWIVPLISFLVMTAGIYVFSKTVLLQSFASKLTRNSVAFFLSTGLTLAIFLATPSPYSSIFWLSGAPIHFWSYGLVLMYFAYLIKASGRKIRLFEYPLMVIIPLLIGMMGEVAMFTLAAGVTLILAVAGLYAKKNTLFALVANAVGVLGAFYALFFSMGAVIRRGAEDSVPVSEVIMNAPYVVAKNFYILITSLISNKTVLIVALLMAMVIGTLLAVKHLHIKRIVGMLVIVTVVCVVLMSLNFVGVYSSVKLTVAWDRTQAFSVIVIIGLLIAYGVVTGLYIKRHYKALVGKIRLGFIAGLVAIVALEAAYIPYITQFTNAIEARAAAYDVREDTIKQMKGQKLCPVAVPSTIINGTQEGQDLWEDQTHALNVGVQRYYRLDCPVTKP